MSVSHPAPAAPPAPPVPTCTRALATRLAALFEQDSEIVERLNDAHHRLARANDRLWSDPVPDVHDVHLQVHRAFCAYQSMSEERRQLAVDVGELSQQLADTLATAGYSRHQARSANVHELAAGTWQPTDEKEMKR